MDTDKSLEARIAELEAVLRIVDEVDALVAQVAPTGAFEYVNPSHKRILEYELQALIGQSVFSFIHPDDQRRVLAALQSVVEQGAIGRVDYRFRHADGSYVWLESVGRPVRDAQGNLSSLIVTSHDITERKQFEQLLRESEEKFRALADSIAVGIFIHQNGVLRYIGREGARLMGYDNPDEMIGRPLMDFIPESDQAYVLDIAKRRTAGEAVPDHYETHLLKKDGSTIDVLMYSMIIEYEGQVATQGAFVDITERKQGEKERIYLQQKIIEAQNQAIKELATPIIPIMDRIIVMPIVGSIDTMRAKDITRALLDGIGKYHAKIVILDITGVAIVDSGVAAYLNKTIQAARLKGAHTIVTGVSDAVAETIVDLGIDWSGLETMADLQTGLLAALKSMGLKLSQD